MSAGFHIFSPFFRSYFWKKKGFYEPQPHYTYISQFFFRGSFLVKMGRDLSTYILIYFSAGKCFFQPAGNKHIITYVFISKFSFFRLKETTR